MSRTRGGTLLSQVHQVSGRVWNKILRDNRMEDLEGARGRVLFALWGKNGVPIKTLCEKTSLDKSTLTGILSRLERDGYVEKRPDETDRRSTLIFLTGKEEGFLHNIDKVSEQMNQIFYHGFSEEEILQFDEMLARILENCKAVEAEIKK
ncbi:MAG: MarR family transcriptional regulator [Lachnospiraceae bacterium]|nr:MarR family transcriptional regulator [Lachnospiraceae bacterium]MDD7147167.1 MarR family transcriptional regulator [Lachnospiraceae bacterium]